MSRFKPFPVQRGWHLAACIASLLAITAPGPVMAQNGAVQQLVNQGNYWHEHARDDLATDTWNKLLRLDPNQPDALLGLARIDLAQGRLSKARERLTTLARAHPDAAQTRELRAALQRGNQSGGLRSARQAAAAGRSAEAVRLYHSLFSGNTPPADLALEYYQAEAGTQDGWAHARAGLEQLSKAQPNDAAVALAYAQALTYRPQTRRQGIRQLQALTGKPAVAKAARDSWRQALIWLDADRADQALFKAYLAQVPNDPAISTRLKQLVTQSARRAAANSPARQAINAGFAALKAKRLGQADSDFQRALKRQPGSPDALGGLGSVRLGQQRFAEAEELLRQAAQHDPSQWRSALQSARYWHGLQQAQALIRQGKGDQAAAMLRQRIKLNPDEPQGYASLGDALATTPTWQQAVQAYQHALDLKAGYPAAIDGLIDLYTRHGQPQKALALMQQLPPAQRKALDDNPALQASRYRAQAQLAENQGDLAAAQRHLEDGMLAQPANPWLRLDLARLYQRQGRADDARSVLDGLLLAHPDDATALYADAIFESENNHWDKALASLERIPAGELSADMRTLQRQAWLHQQANRATRMAQLGHPAEAQALLSQAQTTLGNDLDTHPDLLATLAGAYADAGDTSRAAQLAQGLLQGSHGNDSDRRLLYASVLMKTGQDAELAAVLRQLRSRSLDAGQRQRFDDLRLGYTLRQVDVLRGMGNLEAAYAALAPALGTHPHDPRVIGALARLYEGAGDHKQALDLYRRVLSYAPHDLDTQLAAAQAAAATRNMDQAEDYIRQALMQAPNSPDVLAAAGRVYRVAGNNNKAEAYFRAALRAQTRQAGSGLPAPGTGQGAYAASVNPFAGITGNGEASLPTPSGAAIRAPSPLPGAGSDIGALWGPSASGPAASRALPASAGPMHARASLPTALPAAGTRALAAPMVADTATDPRTATSVPVPLPGAAPGRASGSGNAILDELRQLQGSNSARISAGTTFRTRNGEDGMSKLGDLETPVAVKLHAGSGNVTLRATPTILDANRVDDSYGAASRFGGGPNIAIRNALIDQAAIIHRAQNSNANYQLSPNEQAILTAAGGLTRLPDPGSQTASGVGLDVDYANGGFNADIGTTPLGFRKTNLVGGVRWQSSVGQHSQLTLNLSRRAVTESVLSFAGAKDKRTGASWGGVTANGLRLDAGRDDGTLGMYGYLGGASLVGDHVRSNQRGVLGGGLYLHLPSADQQSLTAGIAADIEHYQRNLRFFTYGQGGYFSPQRYVKLSFPIHWNGRRGDLDWQLNAALGVQSFKEDASPYFPTSSALQGAAEAAAQRAFDLGLSSTAGATYAGQSKTGLSYNLDGALEYRVTPQLFFGGHLGVDNAQDYRQLAGSLYLRYLFDAYGAATPMQPTPVLSPYSY